MSFRRTGRLLSGAICLALITGTVLAQAAEQSPAPPAIRRGKSPASAPSSGIDPGAVTNGVYRNKTLTLTCKIPEAWVLRTDEMNARDEFARNVEEKKEEADPAHYAAPPASSAGAKVLLAAFSRPPEAKGEEINSSILIAAESASSYSGLTE